MASSIYSDPTHTYSLLEAAQRGNSDAIARLLQYVLADEEITVTAQVDQGQLAIILTGGTALESQARPEWIISLIQQSIRYIHPQNIQRLQITWNESTAISSPNPRLSLSPSPIMAPTPVGVLSRDDKQKIANQFESVQASKASRQPHLAIGTYVSRWTEQGLLVTIPQQPTEARWQKRSTVDPAYLCPSITRLLNRQTELKAAIATLQAGGTMEFSGEAGSGKTALLRAICHHPQLLPRFPGGIIYQQAYAQPFEDLLQTLFQAIYQEHSDQGHTLTRTSSQSDSNHATTHVQRKPTHLELKQHLSQHQLCLVLDQLEISPQGLQQQREWPNLALLVSHRNPKDAKEYRHRPTGANTRHLRIKGLPLKDAVVLFEEGLGRSLQPGEEKDAENLCAHLGGHPRRLIQMAALIRKRQTTLSELVEQLQKGTVAEAIILKSVSNLPESDRRIVAILAALGGIPVHSTHLPTLADLDSVTDQLTDLVDQGLAWTDGHFYRLADNLQAPLQQHWNLTPWTDQALAYVKTWLRQFPSDHDQSSWTSPNDATTTTQAVLQNSELLWYLLSHAVHSQRWDDVMELGTLMAPGLWLGQRWGRWRQVLIAQWYAARTLQDRKAEALVLHQLGSRALCLGDGMTAHVCLAQAYAYRIELGDEVEASLSQHNLNILADTPFALSTLVKANTLDQTHPSSNERPQESSIGITLGTNVDEGQLNTLEADIPLTQVMLNQVADHPSTDHSPVDHLPTDHPPEESFQHESIPDQEPIEPAASPPGPAAGAEPTAAVLQTSPKWLPWLWGIVGLGGVALLGLIVLLLGKEPDTNISKLRSKHTFPPQRLGIKSDPHQFTITNSNPSPMTIDVTFEEGDRQDFPIDSEDCSNQPLAPEDTCIITANFDPQTSGPRSASFLVQLGKNTQPKPLTLQGIGAIVNAEPQPFEIAFEQHIVAERSQAKTITFKNKGTVAFMVQTSTLANNEANAFFVEGDSCSGTILQPRDSCNLRVSFLPPEVKNYRTILEIVDDTGNEIWRVPLMGQGVRAPQPAVLPRSQPVPRSSPPRPASPRPASPSPPQATPVSIPPQQPEPPNAQRFTVRPDAIAFNQQALHTSSIQMVRVQNEGTMPVTFTELTLADTAHFEVTEESCVGTSILPGNECVVAIAFTPINTEPYTTTFTITSPQAGDQTITLNGTGIQALASPDPIVPLDPPPASINVFAANPTNTVAPNDTIDLCYDIFNANTAYIRNQATGEDIAIDPASPGCITQTVFSTTTYTLVATSDDGTPIEQSTTIRAIDNTPPSTPAVIGPTGSHPLYCNGPTAMEWKPATDENGPVSYAISLQRQDVSISDTGNPEPSTTWTSLLNSTSEQTRLDITDMVQAPHVYRWHVKSVDPTGNVSSPTGWNEFWCINP